MSIKQTAEGYEVKDVDLGKTDAKGRAIGVRITRYTCAYPGTELPTKYILWTRKLIDGNTFGASHSNSFDTEASRQSAEDKYLKNAKARASSQPA